MSIKNAKEILSSILKSSDDQMSDYIKVAIQDSTNLEKELHNVSNDDHDEYNDDHDEYNDDDDDYYDDIYDEYDSDYEDDIYDEYDSDYEDDYYDEYDSDYEDDYYEFKISEYIDSMYHRYIVQDFTWTIEFTLEQRCISAILDLPDEHQTRENQEAILKSFKLIS